MTRNGRWPGTLALAAAAALALPLVGCRHARRAEPFLAPHALEPVGERTLTVKLAPDHWSVLGRGPAVVTSIAPVAPFQGAITCHVAVDRCGRPTAGAGSPLHVAAGFSGAYAVPSGAALCCQASGGEGGEARITFGDQAAAVPSARAPLPMVAAPGLAAADGRSGARPVILVELPKDRTKCGRLTLLDTRGRPSAGPFTACGVADQKTANRRGNTNRSPLLPYGDTPAGGYRVVHVFNVGEGVNGYPKRSYGDYAAIRLAPSSGDAKLAADIGRTGLLIHGGDPGPSSRLRPTNGCVRLSNADMRALVDALFVLQLTQGPPDTCNVLISATVQISEPEAPDGYDEGDPPPDPRSDVILP